MGPPLIIKGLLFVLTFTQPSHGRKTPEEALEAIDLLAQKEQSPNPQYDLSRRAVEDIGGNLCVFDDYLLGLEAVGDDAIAFCSCFLGIPVATTTTTVSARTYVAYIRSSNFGR